MEAQKATQEFQRAIEILRAAKETIALAEERLLEEESRQFDSAWQEMLNHATQRVRQETAQRLYKTLRYLTRTTEIGAKMVYAMSFTKATPKVLAPLQFREPSKLCLTITITIVLYFFFILLSVIYVITFMCLSIFLSIT